MAQEPFSICQKLIEILNFTLGMEFYQIENELSWVEFYRISVLLWFFLLLFLSLQLLLGRGDVHVVSVCLYPMFFVKY